MYIYPFANSAIPGNMRRANRTKGMKKSSQRENQIQKHWGLLQAETEKDMNVIIRI